MLPWLAGALSLAIQIPAQASPPQILLIAREPLKPGSRDAYSKVEEHTARLSAQLGCPHPYLAIESLAGPPEVWFFNGFNSPAEIEEVSRAYKNNVAFFAALREQSKQKAEFALPQVEVFANYRRELSSGDPWSLGQGRFLVITVSQSRRPIRGTVFETPEGTKFIVTPARTREEADAAAAVAGPQSQIYAVRPAWSFPATEWVAADPEFWQAHAPRK